MEKSVGKTGERDWVGWWFERLREEGESMEIRFGRVGPEGGDPEWFEVPHERHDGIGAFARLLEERGARVPALPGLSEAEGRAFGARITGVLRYLRRVRPPVAEWRGLPAKKTHLLRAHRRWHPPALPTAVAWHVLGREETEALSASARAQGVSLNSLLLWAVARACEEGLELGAGAPQGSMDWMVPVNMRGVIERSERLANHAAFVTVAVAPGSEPSLVHRQVRALLRSGQHWAVWDVLNLGWLLRESGMRRARERDLRSGRRWVGTFSNLGAWPPAGTSPMEGDSAWLFCPPVALSAPFGSGALTWNGRLALTVQLHPALGREPADAARWLGKWKENLHASLARRGTGRAGAGVLPRGDRGAQGLENQV